MMPLNEMIKISMKNINPFGIELTSTDTSINLHNIKIQLLKGLLAKHKLVLIRGINSVDKESLVDYAQMIGPLLAWEFGNVMDMRVHEQPKNYLFTNGHVPFHWDGAFHQEPRYLIFHCVEAPNLSCGGETIFTHTNAIWQDASDNEKNNWIQHKLNYKTEKLAHYGGQISVPLVQTHPDTKDTILRFAEPVPPSMLNHVDVAVEGMNNVNSETFIRDLAERCYRREYCYEHTWHNNDILIADNFSLIHGRRAFKTFSPRFLRRIQVL